MTRQQLLDYDRLLDENDWDIYYWATQEAAKSDADAAEKTTRQPEDEQTEAWAESAAKNGEWARTAGAFRAAYRPVPQRWAESEVLALLREHVRERSATGFRGPGRGTSTGAGTGLGQMPEVDVF